MENGRLNNIKGEILHMWIRSQDEETLMDSNGFTLYEGIEQIKLQCRRIVNDNLNTAIMGKNSGAWYYLGTYKTKERALEVLNDIQKEIIDYQ